jgi:UDP:flavonoid glycosyltransferase YjiC (YdhE family)
MGVTKMRVLLPTCGLRGDVEPLLELVDRSLGYGAEVWVCTLPDFAVLLPDVSVPLAPIGVCR